MERAWCVPWWRTTKYWQCNEINKGWSSDRQWHRSHHRELPQEALLHWDFNACLCRVWEERTWLSKQSMEKNWNRKRGCVSLVHTRTRKGSEKEAEWPIFYSTCSNWTKMGRWAFEDDPDMAMRISLGADHKQWGNHSLALTSGVGWCWRWHLHCHALSKV